MNIKIIGHNFVNNTVLRHTINMILGNNSIPDTRKAQ